MTVITFFFLLFPEAPAQEWVVPADKKGKLSTFPFDDATRKAGEKLYMVNCMSCHGTPTKGNYLKLVPPPGDPATDKIQHNSDGELFYKISSGRGQMPSFKSVLTTNELWNLISYLRSFNSGYKQQVMTVITSTAYPGAEIRLALAYNRTDSTVDISATAVTEKSSVPVAGAEMRLLLHRNFGHMVIDEPRSTDSRGFVKFKLPGDLPGDTAGNIRLMAGFSDEDTFGAEGKDTVIGAGIKTIPVSLTAQRAMWNNVRKAPVWILVTYLGGVLAAWSFIMFVLLKLRDIYIVGESLDKNKIKTE